MSLTGKYSPLNLNSLGSFVQNQGLCINPVAVQHMGTSTALANYVLGSTTQNTVLRMLVHSIRAGFLSSNITCYSELSTIGSSSIPALGDSKPPGYLRTDTLNPYPNSIPYTSEYTSFGWLRTIPLQAHYEFFINNGSYSDFLYTFNMAQGFIGQSNKAIDAMNAADVYLDNVYSNMNDLITSDLAGVSLSLFFWGQDLIASGRAIDLSTIDTFGSPVNLLRTLFKNKALTKAMNLALLASGFSSDDLDYIINGGEPTVEQQKKLYGAYSIVMGEDLAGVLVALNCQTVGLGTLADLLNIKMLFPRSYETITVPEYNATPGPTNSKTYYLLYSGKEVTSQVQNKYGEQLKTIVPASLAASCEAFSTTMLQVKNIKSMDIERFSQVVRNLETVTDLGVNGTNVPTNQPIRNSTLPLIALGNGDKGRYSTCDFFGAMSGLSYDWSILQGYITSLQTSKLFRIYHELYLAITWAPATGSVQITTRYVKTADAIPGSTPSDPPVSPALYTLYYDIIGLTSTSVGGGYSRGQAVPPAATLYEPSAIGSPSGAQASAVIKSDDASGPSGPGNFGQMTNLILVNAGSSVVYGVNVPAADGYSGPPSMGTPTVQIRIERPPTAMLPVTNIGYSSGVNTAYDTAGWPAMNSVVLGYISQANDEIATISTNNPAVTVSMNKLYNTFGRHLTLEQNARSLGLRAEKYLPELSTTVTEIYGFMESLNNYATDTEKWGAVQNLEAITDTATVGGNSMIGGMREVRNAHRLGLTGAEQDNEVGIEQFNLPRVNNIVPTITTTDAVTGLPITVPAISAGPLANIPIETGGPQINGPSFNLGNGGTSPWTSLVPVTLDIVSIISTVKPSVLTPSEAIDEVILCNCDCWDNIL